MTVEDINGRKNILYKKNVTIFTRYCCALAISSCSRFDMKKSQSSQLPSACTHRPMKHSSRVIIFFFVEIIVFFQPDATLIRSQGWEKLVLFCLRTERNTNDPCLKTYCKFRNNKIVKGNLNMYAA